MHPTAGRATLRSPAVNEIVDIEALVREAGSQSLAAVAFEVPSVRDEFVLAASGLSAVAAGAGFLESCFAPGPEGLFESLVTGPRLILRLLPGAGLVVTTAERGAGLTRALEEAWWERTARAGSLAAVWEPCLPEDLGGELCEATAATGESPEPALLAFAGGGVRSRFQRLAGRLRTRLEARIAEVCGPAHDRVAGFLMRCACCGRAPVEPGPAEGPLPEGASGRGGTPASRSDGAAREAGSLSYCRGCRNRMEWLRTDSRRRLLDEMGARADQRDGAGSVGFLAFRLAGAENEERLATDAASLAALGRAWRRVPGLVMPEELAAGGVRLATGPREWVWVGEAGWCLAWLAQAGPRLFEGDEWTSTLGSGGTRLGAGLVLGSGSLAVSQSIGHALALAASAGRVRPDSRGKTGLEFQRLGDGACLSERAGNGRRWAGSSRELVALVRAAGGADA